MSSPLFLGIDCGTQGTKAVVFDTAGCAAGRGYAPHTIFEHANGAREQHPSMWVEAMCIAVRQAMQGVEATAVQALGVSGQQHGLVVLDEAMQVIRPAKLWNDTQTAPQSAALVERLGGPAACQERLGILPLTGYTVSKLLWLCEVEPDHFARIRHILLPHEYLNWWLTGVLAAEPGDASGTGFFDVRSRSWSFEVLDAIDGGTGQLMAALPPLIRNDALLGPVRAEAAKELRISIACQVAAGGGDNMMGAIGTGNVREGVVTISLGTSSTVYSYRKQPVSDASGTLACFCSSCGGWLPLVCTMNATNVVMRTLATLGRSVAEIDTALHATFPGAEGLVMLPFFNGERTPDLPAARGALTGISTSNFRADCLIRAAVEGVSFGVLAGLEPILQGRQPDQILLIGGGARSAAWRQMIADSTGVLVHVPTELEAGCLGAALQAMWAYGVAQCGAKAETLESITTRCVQFDAKATAYPEAARFPLYAEAQTRYRAERLRLYGV